MSSNNISVCPTNSNAGTVAVGTSSPTCAAQAAAAHSAQARQSQSASAFQNPNQPLHHYPEGEDWGDRPRVVDARPILPLAAFYMGDLRDGLPMLNMQAAFLISAKGFNEKQVGILFFVFGMSQFLCMAPAGYFLDYSNKKIDWVLFAGAAASALTVLTAITAEDEGRNMGLMILWKVLQGGITAILPPGFNGITLGIVGSTGFTHQVSRNRMMNHIGTALIVAFGSLLAYFLYPNIGALFLVSPLAAIGMAHNLRRIKPTHVDRDAARCLIIESPTMNEYEQYDEEQEEAAVAAAVESWQIMQDDPNCDPGKAEDHQREILSKLSNLSYTNTSCRNAGGGCGYDDFPSPCGGQQTLSNGAMPPFQASPAASATSSSYMPPDMMAPKGNEAASQQRNTMMLTSPMQPNQEGFQIQPNQMRQRPTSPGASPRQIASARASPNQADIGIAPPLGSRPSTLTYDSGPSFNMGYLPQQPSTSRIPSPQVATRQVSQQTYNAAYTSPADDLPRRASTPLAVLMDKTLMTFTAVIFFFHMANSSVLPLVMQSLALEDPQAGILLSGLCILIAQAFMSYFAKVCGDYSPIWGRKNLVLLGLASLTLRCFLLTGLVSAEIALEEEGGSTFLKVCILSTQLLDAVGAGLLGCLHILVTNDISGGTGRFSLMLGVTTGAMCLGGTVSGYIGQAIAQDYGYPFAFTSLGVMSLVPFLLYILFMPETLPDYARPNQQMFMKRRKRLAALFKRLSESRKKFVAKANPFSRRKSQKEQDSKAQLLNPDGTSPHLDVPVTASHVELV